MMLKTKLSRILFTSLQELLQLHDSMDMQRLDVPPRLRRLHNRLCNQLHQ